MELFQNLSLTKLIAAPTNPIWNKTNAIKIQSCPEINYNKIQSEHIHNVMKKLWEPPKLDELLRIYFDKQNVNENLLKDTEEPITNATKSRTARGHFPKLPYLQHDVDN